MNNERQQERLRGEPAEGPSTSPVFSPLRIQGPGCFSSRECAVRSSRLHGHIWKAYADVEKLEEEVAKILSAEAPDADDKLSEVFRVFSALMTVKKDELVHQHGDVALNSTLAELFESLGSAVRQGMWIPYSELASGPDPYDPVIAAKRAYTEGVRTLLGGPLNVASTLGDHARVSEFIVDCNSPSSQLIARLEEICSELTIDLEMAAPQEGFGRKVTAEELARDLERGSARLFSVETGGITTGFIIVYNDRKNLPANANRAFELWEEKNGDAPDKAGWVEIAGLTKDGRQFFHDIGVNGYRFLTSIVVQSAQEQGIELLLGEVREGAQANLAKPKHLAVGWEDTGLVREDALAPYRVLAMKPFDMPTYVLPGLLEETESTSKEAKEGTRIPSFEDVIANLRFRQPLEAASGFCAPSNDASVPLAVCNEMLRNERLHGEAVVLHCTDGLVIQIRLESGLMASIRQLIPGFDLWRFEGPGDSMPLQSFKDALNDARDYCASFNYR